MSNRDGLALRSLVYHEILSAYLNYVKARGYTSMFIWACPPMAVRLLRPQQSQVSVRGKAWLQLWLRNRDLDAAFMWKRCKDVRLLHKDIFLSRISIVVATAQAFHGRFAGR